ncbi:MAG: protein kinase [Bacteroidota bacterium]
MTTRLTPVPALSALADAGTTAALSPVPTKSVVFPTPGEVITSTRTNNTYTMGDRIGGGNFSDVFACHDVWRNDLAAKVLKPLGTYEHVRDKAIAEVEKLTQLRNPYVTFVFDAFEYRDTFYIITERCYCPISELFKLPGFDGKLWIPAISRCLLQAVHYLHINNFVHQDIHIGNVFAAIVRDEMQPTDSMKTATQFKLADFGIAKLSHEVSAKDTRALWMLPPEVLDEAQFGPIDSRVDIYHTGLLFLQLALSNEVTFTKDEILEGKPRETACSLPAPLNFALEKALRRRVQYRTATALELWRDLNSIPKLAP